MAERKRTRVLNVRIGDDEVAMLGALSDREGLSVSDWIRHTIRVAYRKAFGADAKPPKKRK